MKMKCDYKASWESSLFYQMNIDILHDSGFNLLTNVVGERVLE